MDELGLLTSLLVAAFMFLMGWIKGGEDELRRIKNVFGTDEQLKELCILDILEKYESKKEADRICRKHNKKTKLNKINNNMTAISIIEEFKEYLKGTRAQAIDMETATLFSVGFANRLSVGALLLVSDEPMTPSGVKTEESDRVVTKNFAEEHIQIGVASLKEIQSEGRSIKHLRWR